MEENVHKVMQSSKQYRSWMADKLGQSGTDRMDSGVYQDFYGEQTYYSPNDDSYKLLNPNGNFDKGIVNFATSFAGTEYEWGGKDTEEGGLDCSGLVANYGNKLGKEGIIKNRQFKLSVFWLE